MCGITGIGRFREPLDSKAIETMTGILKHRGPDDEGYLAIDATNRTAQHLIGRDSQVQGRAIGTYRNRADFYLGHRRLSILDPSPAGHQPMCSDDGTIWIIFNGEIYNYIELKAQLKQYGHTFHTTTDTEIILAAYQQWGIKCLDYFDGMWSFVIYDSTKNILFGARDRFGVKPFYYYHQGRYFAFASEIKALINLPFIPKQLNHDIIFDFLVFSGLPFVEESFFKDIQELKPSHAFIFDLNSFTLKKWKYFQLTYNEQSEPFNLKKSRQYISDIKELIYESVQMRLRSDVPVGSALSGGIDSSSIVCVIGQLMSLEGNPGSLINNLYRQQVFTASFPGASIDESQWAQLAAEKSNARWFRTFPKASEFIEDLQDLAYTQDVPFGSPSVYAQYRVMKLARENGVKVLLDGQGADELFTGYSMYYDVFFFQLLKQMNLGTLVSEYINLPHAPVTKKEVLSALIKQIRRFVVPGSILEKYRMDQTRQPHYRYITPGFWEAHQKRFKLLGARDFKSLNGMLYEYFTRQKLSNLLKYEDRNSMRFSVESRTPFADSLNLIDYVFNIPATYKIHHGWSKYLLREAMKGILPDPIRLRIDKKGFFIPDIEWINQLKEPLSQIIAQDKDIKEFINVQLVLDHLEKGMAGANHEMIRTVWNIISFAVWKKVFQI